MGFNLCKVCADQSGIKLKINNTKLVYGKLPTIRKLNNTLLNNPWVIEKKSKGKL